MSARVIHAIAIGLALLISLAPAGEGLASGSSSERPSGPVDRARYELGKKVFAGEFVESQGDIQSQSALLKRLQRKLPSRSRSRVNLPAHAGKLSTAQIEALQYFLKKRYKVR